MKTPNKLVIRCSELSKIMTKSKTKNSPSEGTKSFLMQKAKEDYFEIKTFFGNKYTEKGIQNEDLGIEMVNQSRFMDFKKNDERITLDWITGECDINAENNIIDIKCSWSFDTFPAFQEEANKSVKKSGYDWQLRGYMLLYNKQFGEVIYCLTTTPPDLLGYGDNAELHDVEHVEIENRMTSVKIERNVEKENEMYDQYLIANDYYLECLTELQNKNKK
tara:strand:- start:6752 stop:7408 length:657 start_codon:yes stop_codon:yes gene_type:complete